MGKGHTAEQITRILSEVDLAVAAGDTVSETCYRLGICNATYYLWRKRYGCMTLKQLKRLKALERENARLARELADLCLDNTILKGVLHLGKHETDPAWRRHIIRRIQEELGVSERRACMVLSQSRDVQRYELRRRETDRSLIEAMNRLSKEHPEYGYRRVMALLRAEGWSVNHKRVYRLWRQEGMRRSGARRKVDEPPSDE